MSPQYTQELTTGLRSQFPRRQSAVIIRIGCLEPLFDDGEVFVFAYRAILVGVHSHKLPCTQSAAQLMPGESAVVVITKESLTTAATRWTRLTSGVRCGRYKTGYATLYRAGMTNVVLHCLFIQQNQRV